MKAFSVLVAITGKADWKDESQIKNTIFLGEVIAFYQKKKTVQIKGQICHFLLELSKFFKSTADHLRLNFREYSQDDFEICW